MPQPIKPVPPKNCKHCSRPLQRKMFGGRLEDRATYMRRIFCDQKCMGQAKITSTPTLGALRSRTSRAIKKKSACEQCGSTILLNIHHKDEDKANNSPENCMTLCASCHARWHWENGKQSKPPRRCKVCGEVARRKWMCQKHWFRYKKHGDPNLTLKPVGRGQYVLVRMSPRE